ncbi:hypothetical protein HY485_05600 [Candidatus Woesearchaeota archaeon]|nr:hypothetical protein [Candidatus Woesearchaeota archaeon]
MSNLVIGTSIVEGKIEFYSHDRKLDVVAKKCDAETEKAWLDCNASEFDKYVWRLERHLAKQAKDYLTINGDCLESFLVQPDNVYDFADFALGIHVGTKDTVKVWVDVDIDKIAKNYEGKRKGALVNMVGTVKINTSKWARGMSVFERDWNIALCEAWGGFVGYPGYEWPRTAKQFENHCVYHAQSILIGTKKQLSRYEVLADKSPGYTEEIRKALSYFRK